VQLGPGSRRAAPGGKLASAWPRSLTATPGTGNLTSANAPPTRFGHTLRTYGAASTVSTSSPARCGSNRSPVISRR
jgi:hypothetical protein